MSSQKKVAASGEAAVSAVKDMCVPSMVLEPDTSELHLEVIESGSIRCHGTGTHHVMVHRPGGVRETVAVDLTRFTIAELLLP